MKLKVALVLVAGVLLGEGFAAAHPLEVYGLGARSISLAGADIGAQADYASGFSNPASAALVESPLFATGGIYFANQLRLGSGSGGAESATGVFASFVYPLTLSQSHKLRWGSGLAVYVPQQRVVRIRFLPPYIPRFLQFDNRVHRMVATFFNSISWHGVSVGVGINLFAGADGRGALFKMRSTPGKYEVSDGDLNLSLSTLLYPSAGILWRTERVTLGFFYIRQVQHDIFTATDADMHIDLGYATLEGKAGSSLYAFNYFTPDTYGLGSAVAVIPNTLTVYGSLMLLDWRDYPGAAVRLEPKIDLELSGSEFPVEVVLYKYKEPSLGIQVIAALGAEAKFELSEGVRLQIRAGYRFASSPIEETGEIALLDNPRHCVAAGAGVRLPAVGVLGFETEINFGMSAQFLVPQTYSPPITAPVEPFEYGGYILGGSADVVLHF